MAETNCFLHKNQYHSLNPLYLEKLHRTFNLTENSLEHLSHTYTHTFSTSKSRRTPSMKTATPSQARKFKMNWLKKISVPAGSCGVFDLFPL